MQHGATGKVCRQGRPGSTVSVGCVPGSADPACLCLGESCPGTCGRGQPRSLGRGSRGWNSTAPVPMSVRLGFPRKRTRDQEPVPDPRLWACHPCTVPVWGRCSRASQAPGTLRELVGRTCYWSQPGCPLPFPGLPGGLDTWLLGQSEHSEACCWDHWCSWGRKMFLCRDQRGFGLAPDKTWDGTHSSAPRRQERPLSAHRTERGTGPEFQISGIRILHPATRLLPAPLWGSPVSLRSPSHSQWLRVFISWDPNCQSTFCDVCLFLDLLCPLWPHLSGSQASSLSWFPSQSISTGFQHPLLLMGTIKSLSNSSRVFAVGRAPS